MSMKNHEFIDVLRLYGDMAYRMALQLTRGQEADARDLVQETFMRIWRHWETDRPSSMKGWMYRVLKNLHLDSVRYRNRHPAISLETSTGTDNTWEDILPDGQTSVDHFLEKKELQKHVAGALAQLDEDFRFPVMLCDMEGLPYEDIARILNCPIGTVRSRIHRGRVQLRQLLETSEVTL
jgi:RNA polymerase sigma-70 factor (ECF subfamily)